MATTSPRGFVNRCLRLDKQLDDTIQARCAERGEMFAPIVRSLLRQALADELAETTALPEPTVDREPALSGAAA